MANDAATIVTSPVWAGSCAAASVPVRVDAGATTIVGTTGTKSEFDTAVSDGNIIYVGDSVPASTLTGTLAAAQEPAHTGDVTNAAASLAMTIAADAVTYAKMQNVSALSKLIGRGDSGAGDPQEITLGAGLTMTGTTLAASGGSSLGGAATITLTPAVYEWTETVTATGVTAAHKIVISAGAYIDADENSAEMLDGQCLSGTAATNQIIVTAAFAERTSGPVKLNWSAF